jgi:hypothetical protein
MTWKLTPWGKTRSGVTGIPWRDLSDEEFAAAEAMFEPGELLAHGYFEKEAIPVVESVSVRVSESEFPRRTRKFKDTNEGSPPAEEE